MTLSVRAMTLNRVCAVLRYRLRLNILINAGIQLQELSMDYCCGRDSTFVVAIALGAAMGLECVCLGRRRDVLIPEEWDMYGD